MFIQSERTDRCLADFNADVADDCIHIPNTSLSHEALADDVFTEGHNLITLVSSILLADRIQGVKVKRQTLKHYAIQHSMSLIERIIQYLLD